MLQDLAAAAAMPSRADWECGFAALSRLFGERPRKRHLRQHASIPPRIWHPGRQPFALRTKEPEEAILPTTPLAVHI